MNIDNVQSPQVEASKAILPVEPAGNFTDIALPLIARGIPVIPIPRMQKGANLSDWPNQATTDPEQIEEWHKENPHYNVGSVAKLDGLWMLDCDVPDLPDIIAKDTGESFPETFSVKANKGLHFYFKHSAASRALKKNLQLKDKDGKVLCDVKVHNGYVVGPGSIHPSGKRYEVVNDSEIVEAPECLIHWIKGKKQHAECDQHQHSPGAGKIPEGGRDNYLFGQACKLRNAGLSKENALVSLLEINKADCAPPMPDSVVHKKIESAYSYEAQNRTHAHDPNEPHTTDLGNALRLVVAEGKDIRYCVGKERWYVWNGQLWQEDDTGEIYRRAEKTIKAMLSEASQLEGQEREELLAHEKRCESQGRINAMVDMASWRPGIPIRMGEFDRDPMLFNCKNGTIDLRSGILRECSRSDLITKAAGANYDANATCPAWLSVLDTVTDHNADLMAYLQRCVGYSLTGMTTEHAIFLLYGTGANGKTTFLEVLRYVFEKYSDGMDFGSLLVSNSRGVRNDIARLQGARLVTASESPSGQRLDETMVKQLTGGDNVTARLLFHEYFEFSPQCKIWLGTNHKPTIRGQDDGVWRRIRLIPFTVSIPREKQDCNLIDKLRTEGSGILNWALEGLAEWREKDLQEPHVVADATEDYRTNEDVLAHFLESCCIKGSEHQVTARRLYEKYKEWVEQTNEYPMRESLFSNAMAERGYKKVRLATGFVWKGINVRQPENQPNPDVVDPI